MARNGGSKYARKHSLDKQVDVLLFGDTKHDDGNNDLWDILYNPFDFQQKFLALPYPRQIEMVGLLNHIITRSNKCNLTKIERAFAVEAEKHLNVIHALTKSSYDCGIYEALSNDEKRLIRMECYGSINRRQNHQLSEFYKFFIKQEKLEHIRRGIRFKLSDYKLEDSPSWRVFNQFETFRKIAPRLKRYFYESNINPDVLKVMTISDFCDSIYQAFKKNDNDDCANFIPKHESLKYRYVKTFMKHCGAAYEKILLHKGIDERCVKSMCNSMRRFGICDINSLIVTETHYTPRILNDLAAAKFDVSEIKVGDRISQNFTDELLDNNQAYLILARDENGKPLDKSDLPVLELHHKHAVRFAASNGYLARTNYPENMLLTDSAMHARYYHLFDQVISNNKIQNFYSRLNITSKDMCLLIGFNPEDAIHYDMENTKAFQKRVQEDIKAKINYFDMMEQRLINEQELALRYNLNYSRIGFNKVNHSLKELSQKMDLDKDKMKIFKNWLCQNYKGRKGK